MTIEKERGKVIGILVLIASIIALMCLASAVRAKTEADTKRNMFYVQIINYTIPGIKETNFDEETMAENNFSIGKEILSIFGINISNPEELLGKELSCLDGSGYSRIVADNTEDITDVDKFVLDNRDISKKPEDQSSSNISQQDLKVYNPSLKKTLDTSKPEILIYHTHTSESYRPAASESLDPSKSVVAVGDELSKELQDDYGISVIHDKTVHDVENYNKAYTKSGQTVDKYLSKYKDFKMIIDLHRDSVEDRKLVTAKINGETVAKFMFVMARKNPHYDKNIALVNSLVGISQKYFPGLCSDIYYYDYGTNYFNQAKSNNAFLVEVGSDCNDLTEAKATTKYLARVIAEYLNGKR
ncbi:MAG: stage II sporulation protein P [Bacillota bacterium]|nr:stage II sporulation protein P [Bacillota bacterium]